MERGNNIFRARANAELSTPYSETAADVILRASFLQGPESILINGVGYPADGPHLPVVGMSAKLKIDARLLGFFKMIGLMVEKDSVAIHVQRRRKGLYSLTPWVLCRLDRGCLCQ